MSKADKEELLFEIKLKGNSDELFGLPIKLVKYFFFGGFIAGVLTASWWLIFY